MTPNYSRPARASTTIDLPSDLRSPALARRAVTSALQGGRHEDLLGDALLLVTELVTNAVVHAGTSARLNIDTTDEHGTRFEVTDRSPATVPVQRTPSPTSSGGRGLMLLGALAQSWGTVHSVGEKSVWFTLGATPGRGRSAAPAHLDSDRVWPATGMAAADARLVRWLLMLDVGPTTLGLDPSLVLSESLHRLCDALEIDSAALVAVGSNHRERRQILAERGDPFSDAVLAAESLRAESIGLAGPPPTEQAQSFPVVAAGAVTAVLILATRQALSEVQATAVELVCRRLGTILIEQRLQVTADRARGNAALLAEASELFSGTLDADLALKLATQLVVPRFARWAAAWSVPNGRPVLAAVSHDDEDAAQIVREALGDAGSIGFARRLVALLDGRPTALLSSQDLPSGLGERYAGECLAVALSARHRLLAVLLLAGGGGDTTDPAARTGAFDADSVALLTDLSARAATGIEVARLFREQHDVATALQASLLPRQLPVTPDLSFGARYVAAGEMNTVGGDFYDVFQLDNRDWAVVVGDVCGRGPEAAAITGLARSVLRVALRDGRTPAEACTRLNREILELGPRGRFCTSALAVLHAGPTHTSVRITLAGHPPPVLARATGLVELVGQAGTLVGVRPQMELEETELHLAAGDSLVFYTDGVTERRRGPDMLGESGLIAAVSEGIGLDADGLAGAVERTVNDFSPEVARDDLAIVVVQRRVAPAKPAPQLAREVALPL